MNFGCFPFKQSMRHIFHLLLYRGLIILMLFFALTFLTREEVKVMHDIALVHARKMHH